MLIKLLDTYSLSSGHKVNEKKSVIMGLNIEGLRNKLKGFTSAEWKQKGVRYLSTRPG